MRLALSGTDDFPSRDVMGATPACGNHHRWRDDRHALSFGERSIPLKPTFFCAFGHLEGLWTFLKGRVAPTYHECAAGGSHDRVRQAA